MYLCYTNEIPGATGLVAETGYDAIITEFEIEIADVTEKIKKSNFDTRLRKLINRVNSKEKHK